MRSSLPHVTPCVRTKHEGSNGVVLELVVTAMAAVMGIVIAISGIWWVVRSTPDIGELERLRGVNELYNGLAQNSDAGIQKVFFLGNSIVIEGIDARMYEELSIHAGEAFNIATTGASLQELALHVPRIMKIGPSTVFIFVHPSHFERTQEINEQKLIVYKLLDFSVGVVPPTLHRNDQSYLLSRSILGILDARFLVRSILDDGLRFRIRSDLRSNNNEFKNPSVYTRSLPADQVVTLIERNTSNETFIPKSHHFESLKFIVESLASNANHVVIVLSPLHPWYVAFRGEEEIDKYRNHIRSAAENMNSCILDATELLDVSQFIDDVHPNKNGRETLTHTVASGEGVLCFSKQ